MRDELSLLIQKRRSLLSQPNAVSEKTMHLEHRIARLTASLGSAEVVYPPPEADGVVRLGATVRTQDREGRENTFRIVGIDEADAERGWVSWLSPIAKAPLNQRQGDRMTFRFPAGEAELTIISVSYE